MNHLDIWQHLQRVQHELKYGSPDTQDEAINELHLYLETSSSILFPSFIYPSITDVLTYYCTDLLSHLTMSAEDRRFIREGVEDTLGHLNTQKQISQTLEGELRNWLNTFKAGDFTSASEVIVAFQTFLFSLSEEQFSLKNPAYDRTLEIQYQRLQAAFTSRHVLPFLRSLCSPMLSEHLKVQFDRIQALFWDQLQEFLQPKAVLVHTHKGEARIIRLDITTSLKSSTPDTIAFENDVDKSMQHSCRRALQAARVFLEEWFPGTLGDQFLQVACQFRAPLVEYTDTSASLLIAVKIIGDILDLEIHPEIIISGEVDEKGYVLPVEHVSEKLRKVEQEPTIQALYLPAQGHPATSNHLAIFTMQKFSEAVQSYYGRYQLRAIRHCDDWGDAPEMSDFVGRENELRTLEQWILHDRCRVVAIVGIKGIGKTHLSIKLGKGGIGKTDLSLKLVQGIQYEFDHVVWRSLLNAPPLEEILSDLIKIVSYQQESYLPNAVDAQISRVFDYFRTQRCLLILDNVETILHGGELIQESGIASMAGQYREGYEHYGVFFKRVGEVPHQSCLLLTSREKPHEITLLAGEERPVRLLELEGLDEVTAKELFMIIGSFSGTNEEWERLIECYNGNPLALELAARYIHDTFHGNIAEFLQTGRATFDNLYDLLDWHFERLSEREREIMYWLAINREPVSEAVLQDDLLLPDAKASIHKTIQSLEQRLPLEQSESGITLQPVLMEYMTRRFIEHVGEEIHSANIYLFNRHALLKATAKDYIRETQVRLILKPILLWTPVKPEEVSQLLTRLHEESLRQPGYYLSDHVRNLFQKMTRTISNSHNNLEERLKQLLTKLRNEYPQQPGYAAGNILNVLCHLKDEIKGYDFSHLAVWQAYLKGKVLRDIDFTSSDLLNFIFTQNFGSIASVAFSPNGKILATGDSKGFVCLLQIPYGQQISVCDGHADWVWSVDFSSDGKILASASADRTIKIWDVYTGRCLKTLQGHTDRVMAVLFNPFQRGEKQTVISASDDQTIRIWDVGTGECLSILYTDTSKIALSPDGKTLVSVSENTKLLIWDLATRQCTRKIAQNTNVKAVAISPDGQVFSTAGDDSIVRIWNLRTGQCLKMLQGHSRGISAIALSPDGQNLASGGFDQKVKIWNISTGQCLKTLQDHIHVISVAFSPDGQMLASGSDDPIVRIWDVHSGHVLNILHGYTNRIWSVAFSPNGQLLASGSDDSLIRIWDVESGCILRVLKGHSNRIWSVDFGPDGNLLVSGGEDQTVRLWDVNSGQCLNTFQGHTNRIRSVSFSPDGRTLASCGNDNTIKLWEINTGYCYTTLRDHTSWVQAVAFSPDGEIFVSCSNDTTLRIWDAHTAQCLNILRGHTDTVRSLTFNPEGKTIVSCGEDNTLRIWDVSEGQLLNTLKGHTNWIISVAFSPDGSMLASTGYDQKIRLWSFSTGECCKILKGHTDRVSSIIFDPVNQKLVSAGYDETIRFWDIRTGQCLQTMKLLKPYEGMNITDVTGLTEAQKTRVVA